MILELEGPLNLVIRPESWIKKRWFRVDMGHARHSTGAQLWGVLLNVRAFKHGWDAL